MGISSKWEFRPNGNFVQMGILSKQWWQRLQAVDRQQWIVVVNGAIATLILGRIILDPNVGKPHAITLPETTTLTGWTLTNSDPLDVFTMPTGESDQAPVGQRYTFISLLSDHNPASISHSPHRYASTLTVELRYMQETQGFVQRLLLAHPEFQAIRATVTAAEAQPVIRYQQGVGYYGLFQMQQQTYLSACINPRGESTFTIDQFRKNQQIYDADPSRFFAVILGREAWRDDRCLWTHMAIAPDPAMLPTRQTLREQRVQLEAAWVEWYQMWQPQFPGR